MKMIYNGTPIKSLNIKHYEMDTNSATVQPSDLQVGVTCYGRGKKITGTGRSFEFAYYGGFETNSMNYVPSTINVIEIASVNYPIKTSIDFNNMRNIDFTVEQTVGVAIIDNMEYPIIASIKNSIFTLSCEKTITLEIFFGKDNYV